MENEALWRRLIDSKYGSDKWGWWPKLVPSYCRSGVWRDIIYVGDKSNMRGKALHKGVGFIIGDGTCVRFWLDDWVGMGPLSELFPRIFRLVVNKESCVSDYFEVRSGCMVWEVPFRRTLWQMEEFMYQKMLKYFR